ncbi:MAG: hypothetical protein JW857_05715 [Bacteroidales bacterium]|nr:hypothetical protein [Bacteroidales bacterium]
MKINLPNFLISILLLVVLILNFVENGIGEIDTYELIKIILIVSALILSISLFIKNTWFRKGS